tara:strand:+ start:210 stop:485 length:276 start_codon:yes stop_codon:yes gene_type:complete
MKRITLSEILFWIFFVIAVIFFFWYLFGDSPTLVEAFLVLIVGALLKMMSTLGYLKSNIESLNKKFNNIENSFSRLAIDFKSHINDKKLHK